MIITINIENQQDYQWLAPFLEALKQYPNAKVKIETENKTNQDWATKVKTLFKYIEENTKSVEKIDIPNRDERNER